MMSVSSMISPTFQIFFIYIAGLQIYKAHQFFADLDVCLVSVFRSIIQEMTDTPYSVRIDP